VIIEGQTGTGKEVIARVIHGLSQRGGPFVAVNCGALPRDLVEAELFGHRKGAFSGATDDHTGLVCSADGGTLLLDEIGDLSAPSQAAFLRVLQEHEVRPVGATRAVRVDLRVVAATHR
jgi:transcriptional regulator with GAF, ATPase, and Fis domain